MKTCATFSELLQAYFTDRLMRQRNASPNTVASHRDTFRLLLGFAQRVLHKPPTALAVDDLTPAFLGRFLDYLEKDRGNVPRSRNARLAAIRSAVLKPMPQMSRARRYGSSRTFSMASLP